ncbi:hypothetical protein V8C37DRAFT_383616 [Trichoderma ceciliae]
MTGLSGARGWWLFPKRSSIPSVARSVLISSVWTPSCSRQIGYPLLALTIIDSTAAPAREWWCCDFARDAPFFRAGPLLVGEERRTYECSVASTGVSRDRGAPFRVPMQKISRHSDEISHDTYLAHPLTHHATNRSDQARPASAPHKTTAPRSVRQVVSDPDDISRSGWCW